MSIAAVFDDPTGKVTLTVTAAPANAVTVYLQRSVDQVSWTDVRGGQAVALSAGAASLIDYEYTAGQVNYYRASYSGPTGIFVAKGVAATGNNVTLNPALPAGIVAGDLLLLIASIRSTFSGGHVTQPTGWDPTGHPINGFQVYSRIAVAGDGPPSVAFTGGAAGDDVIAQVAAFRFVGASSMEIEEDNAVAAQNVGFTNLTTPADGMVIIAGWKSDDNTSVAAPAGFTQIDNVSSIVGNDASVCWFYRLTVPAGTVIGPGSIVVTGGAAATSASHVISFASASFDITSVTPNQTAIWLKTPTMPFLNQTVRLTGPLAPVTRDPRSGLFDIIARTQRVSVTDLMSGQGTSYTFWTDTRQQVVDLDLHLAVGEVMLFQPPGGSNLETLYFSPGQPSRAIFTETSPVRLTTLPMSECAPPDLSVAAVQSTYQTVLNTYATYAALLAAKATYADVLLLVGSAADVITG